jgi:flagellar protein FlaG
MDIRSIANSAKAPVLTDSRATGLTAGAADIAEQRRNALNVSRGSREDIEAAVATIQDFAQSVSRSLNFSLEEASGRVVVKVTDSGSGDVIRQIPSEEALQLAENLSEVRSLLFKAEA